MALVWHLRSERVKWDNDSISHLLAPDGPIVHPSPTVPAVFARCVNNLWVPALVEAPDTPRELGRWVIICEGGEAFLPQGSPSKARQNGAR